MRMSPQHSTLPKNATGRATANQVSQEGGSPPMDMRSMAKMFWGDEMGDVMPPAGGVVLGGQKEIARWRRTDLVVREA